MINAYSHILTKTREYFTTNWSSVTNTITQGDMDDIDLSKRTIFPLVHILISTAEFNERSIVFNMSIIAMDVVDITSDAQDKSYFGTDNEVDVLNSMLTILGSFYVSAKRGNLFDSYVQIEQVGNAEKFTERFENYVAGWVLTFDLTIPNELGLESC